MPTKGALNGPPINMSNNFSRSRFRLLPRAIASENAIMACANNLNISQDFNPENNPEFRQHSVFLNDIGMERVLLGFEDLHRQEGWCDHDFNEKGLENGQANAVAIVFDDTYNLMFHTGEIGVNTNPTYEYVTPDTINIYIVLSQPTPLSVIGIPPYYPCSIISLATEKQIIPIRNRFAIIDLMLQSV